MPGGRPLIPLTISPAERGELVSITRSRSMPQALATRARIVLLAADGHSNTDIAERLGLSKPTVGIWRKRYLRQRLQGLYDEPRPGGPRSIRDDEVAAGPRGDVPHAGVRDEAVLVRTDERGIPPPDLPDELPLSIELPQEGPAPGLATGARVLVAAHVARSGSRIDGPEDAAARAG